MLLPELQRIRDTVKCAKLFAEVSGHCQKHLTQTFNLLGVCWNTLVYIVPKIKRAGPPKARGQFAYTKDTVSICEKSEGVSDQTWRQQWIRLPFKLCGVRPEVAVLWWIRRIFLPDLRRNRGLLGHASHPSGSVERNSSNSKFWG